MKVTATPVFDHLRRITGEHGLYEHALLDEPRVSHGYTTDDNARALVVIARASRSGIGPIDVEPYLGFVLSGVVAGGWHNRMTASGQWSDLRGPDDSHGRAIWALGEMVAGGWISEPLLSALQAGVLSFESTHPRAVAYAVFGAASALESGVLSDLMSDFLLVLTERLPSSGEGPWIWPEPRLTYDNARLPEAAIRAGSALGDSDRAEDGLRLLSWLIKTETRDHHFSFTPVGGRGESGRGPSFDQQPLEAWAMADACYAAMQVEQHPGWHDAAMRACDWFLGANDGGLVLYDTATGAGFDGLEEGSVNQNRGAESTLAALGSLVTCERMRSGEGGE